MTAEPRPEVAAVIARWPAPAQRKALTLRRLILNSAARTDGVGRLTETLKWGEPAYLTEVSRSGSTVRIGWSEKHPERLGSSSTARPTW